jgi:hypothetical protein
MSLSTSCRRTRSSLALLSRRLVAGIEPLSVLAAQPIAHRGEPGWRQIVETEEEGRKFRLETVTIRYGACLVDWMLVAPAPDSFEAWQPLFEAWWVSLRPVES